MLNKVEETKPEAFVAVTEAIDDMIKFPTLFPL